MYMNISRELATGPGDPKLTRDIVVNVTNGMEAVTIGLSDQPQALMQGKAPTSQHVSMTPEEAVQVAVAILNAAWNTREHIHGSSAAAKFDDKERAKHILRNTPIPR